MSNVINVIEGTSWSAETGGHSYTLSARGGYFSVSDDAQTFYYNVWENLNGAPRINRLEDGEIETGETACKGGEAIAWEDAPERLRKAFAGNAYPDLTEYARNVLVYGEEQGAAVNERIAWAKKNLLPPGNNQAETEAVYAKVGPWTTVAFLGQKEKGYARSSYQDRFYIIDDKFYVTCSYIWTSEFGSRYNVKSEPYGPIRQARKEYGRHIARLAQKAKVNYSLMRLVIKMELSAENQNRGVTSTLEDIDESRVVRMADCLDDTIRFFWLESDPEWTYRETFKVFPEYRGWRLRDYIFSLAQ